MFEFLRAEKHPKKIQDKALIDKTYKHWRIRILLSMYFGYAFFYFTRKSLVFATPELMKNLHFTKIEIGILGSAFYITYGISKFISGMLSDKSNPRYFLAIGLMMTGIANIVFGFFSSLPILAAIWIVNAFFQGWGWPPCARLLTHWYSQRERGVWWGIWNTSHNFGGALIPIIVGFVATFWGWRYAMFVPGIIAIVMGLIIMKGLRGVPESLGLPPIEEYKNDYPQGREAVENSEKTPLKEILFKYVLRNKYIWLLCFAYVTVYIVRTAFNDWGNLYLTEHGYTLMSADDCLSFFEIGGFFGSLVAGWMSDRIFDGKRGPVNVLYSVGIAAAIIAFRMVPGVHFALHAACIFAIGFLIFGPQMLIGMAAAELSHREAAGTATGFAGLFGYLGAALSGFPVGYITQHWGWTGFFTLMLGCCAVTIVLLIPMWSVKVNPEFAPPEN